MKEYSKEESRELIDKINKMQKAVFKFKKENGRDPTDKEIADMLNVTYKSVLEIKGILIELEEQDKIFYQEYKTDKHTKEDIEKARQARKAKKEIKDIQKYLKGE